MLQDAVIREIEIIGEAAKNLSKEFRSKHPDIPWRQIAGMRDKLIHMDILEWIWTLYGIQQREISHH
ncbi:MAG: HEPN domain protein [Candidatus Alkanophagales archaeon MCA70_species_1]|nr:HEPN domain protein [Candidatus Alkanophaga volatiphilum]